MTKDNGETGEKTSKQKRGTTNSGDNNWPLKKPGEQIADYQTAYVEDLLELFEIVVLATYVDDCITGDPSAENRKRAYEKLEEKLDESDRNYRSEWPPIRNHSNLWAVCNTAADLWLKLAPRLERINLMERDVRFNTWGDDWRKVLDRLRYYSPGSLVRTINNAAWKLWQRNIRLPKPTIVDVPADVDDAVAVCRGIMEWYDDILTGIEGQAPLDCTTTGNSEPSSRKRPKFERDHLWLRWRDEGMTPANIRDRWNEQNPGDAINLDTNDNGISVVKNAIKKAEKERDLLDKN